MKQLALNIEEKQLLQDALQRTQQAMKRLDQLVIQFPHAIQVVEMRKKQGALLAESYVYLLSLAKLETWHCPSWLPQIVSFERDIEVIFQIYSEVE